MRVVFLRKCGQIRIMTRYILWQSRSAIWEQRWWRRVVPCACIREGFRMLQISDVSKRFKKKQVLSGINIQLEQGIYALLGVKGA